MSHSDGYGILVDYHATREDGGVPCIWDGWYSQRQDALAVLALAKERYPGANVSLIEQLNPGNAQTR